MVDQIAMVTVTINATGTFAFTDPSITETFKAAILIWGGIDDDDSTDHTHAVMGMGFVAVEAGAAQEETAYCVQAENGLTVATDTRTRHATQGQALVAVDGTNAASERILATYLDSVAGGFRLSVGTFSGQPVKVTALIFAGLDRAYADLCAGSTLGVHEDVGGTTDFEPDVVFFIAGDATVSNATTSDGAPNLGFAVNDGGPSQVCAYLNSDHAVTTSDADGFLRSANAYAHAPSRTGGALNEAFDTVTSFDATGFNHTSSAGTPDAHYLALKFSGNVRIACANMAVAGATGLQAFNAFGFTPDAVIGMSTLLGSVDSEIDGATAAACGLFLAGRYGSRAVTWRHREGVSVSGGTPTEASTRHEDVAVLTYSHLGAVAQRATWAGATGGGGFLLDFTTATGGHITALGIQLVPNPPLLVRRPPKAPKARFQRIRRLTLIGTKQIGSQPLLLRLLKEVGRLRRRLRARLVRRPATPTTLPMQVGEEVDESLGVVTGPGMVRGAIVGGGLPSEEP